jgi:hypothetical protein
VVGKQRSKWQGVECDLIDEDGVFIVRGQEVACAPKEAIFNDQLDEDHVGLCILYCPRTALAIMIIWKCTLLQTILDKYPLRKHFIVFNETHTLDDEDVGVVSVKKIYIFS